MKDTDTISLRFTFEAGMLVRKATREYLESIAFVAGVTLEIQEQRGWLESRFLVTISGEANAVRHVKDLLEVYFD